MEAEEEFAVVSLSEMFKTLGHKLELLNSIQEKGLDSRDLDEAAVEIRIELVMQLTRIKDFFRDSGPTGG